MEEAEEAACPAGRGRDSNAEARAGEQDQSVSRAEEEAGHQRLEGDHRRHESGLEKR